MSLHKDFLSQLHHHQLTAGNAIEKEKKKEKNIKKTEGGMVRGEVRVQEATQVLSSKAAFVSQSFCIEKIDKWCRSPATQDIRPRWQGEPDA